MSINPAINENVEKTLTAARDRLLVAREATGHWEGRLSSSALSTATSVCALELLVRATHTYSQSENTTYTHLVERGLQWLALHQNDDGGWGDTVDSPSNISTTVLVWAALGLREKQSGPYQTATRRAQTWLMREAGGLDAAALTRALSGRYGKDRTFSVPILTMCALTGRLGAGRSAWRHIPALPFELAVFPHTWFRRLKLSVVSYALPALIAIGQVRHHHRPTRNPIARCLRRVTREKTLQILESIQPENGGFLEAAPLTGFVAMSLIAMGRVDHPVVKRGIAFLAASVREDGSWPIDTNLATWLTTLSIQALSGGGPGDAPFSTKRRIDLRDWLLDQQFRVEHPYTHARPGGWAWTNRSGGVPDADDTAGALLALRYLVAQEPSDGGDSEQMARAVTNGIGWLIDLQNKDGGIPTFCRGWGKLPFDRSSPDLTAHALRAWSAWRKDQTENMRRRMDVAIGHALRYLQSVQQPDGAWLPLWFGSQQRADQQNPLYGTARVLCAVAVSDETVRASWVRACRRAISWLLAAQQKGGGWGADVGLTPSIEETALAVEALATLLRNSRLHPTHIRTEALWPMIADDAGQEKLWKAIGHGCAWLAEHTEGGTRFDAAPIGLYFARLWYFEQLYPIVFTVSALERVCGLLRGRAGAAATTATDQPVSCRRDGFSVE